MEQGAPQALRALGERLGLSLSDAVVEQAQERLASLELQRALWMLQGLDPGLEPFQLVRGESATAAARVLGLSWVLGVCLQGEAAARVALLEQMPGGRALLGAIRPLGSVQEVVDANLASLRARWTGVVGDTLAQAEVMLPKVLRSLEDTAPGVGPHSFRELGERFVWELALRQAADPEGALAPSAALTPPPELTLSSTAGVPLGPPRSAAPLPGAPKPKLRPFPMPEEPFVPAQDAHWPPAPEGPLLAPEPAPEPDTPPPLSGPPGQAREASGGAPSGARALPLVVVGAMVAVMVLLALVLALAVGAMTLKAA